MKLDELEPALLRPVLGGLEAGAAVILAVAALSSGRMPPTELGKVVEVDPFSADGKQILQKHVCSPFQLTKRI